MIIFYDPNDNNQIMAKYTEGTNSTVWGDRGYLQAEVLDEALFLSLDRDHTVVVSDDVVISTAARTNRVELEFTYSQKRLDAYPAIGDQLDMQYHDLVDSTTTWADAIAAVKSKYPKPG